MGFRGAAEGFQGAATWGLKGQQHGVLRGSNTDKTSQCFYHFLLSLEVPGKQMGPRGTARNDKSTEVFYQCCCAFRSHVAAP